MTNHFDPTHKFWNSIAEDWQTQVGTEGDTNRRLNSDPVLWNFAGEVPGLKVLDAGCGTGYLSAKLAERGAQVTGIDFSERMIAIARENNPAIDFRVDSCSQLATVANTEFDLIVSNYVLMDLPDLTGAVNSFHRVLKPGGIAVLVFSHPCFPAGRSSNSDNGEEVTYNWNFPYFNQKQQTDPPWAHFKSDFIWFHRPLSDYWKAFKTAGFDVIDFEEPRLTNDRHHLAESETALKKNQSCPYSVAFKLRKRKSSTQT